MLHARRGHASGYLITTQDDGSPEIVEETRQCCHCGGAWVYKPGSGIRRGVCVLCNGHTCGRPECDECVPLEQLLENIERNNGRELADCRPLNYRPVRVHVGELPNACRGGIELCTNDSKSVSPAPSLLVASPPAQAA